MTNITRIKNMSTEELAEYLFDRGNGSEYCYGICAHQDECDGLDHAQEFCIEQICKWLEREEEEHEYCTQQDHQKCMECMCADEYVGPDEDKVRAAADDYCNKIKKVFGR